MVTRLDGSILINDCARMRSKKDTVFFFKASKEIMNGKRNELIRSHDYILYLFPTFNVGILMPKCSSCFHFRHLMSEIWLIHILCSKECFKNLPTEPRKLKVMWVRFLNAFFYAKYEICCSWRGTRTKWWRSWGSSAGLSRQGIEKHEPAGFMTSQK